MWHLKKLFVLKNTCISFFKWYVLLIAPTQLMLAFSCLMWKWDCPTLNFICDSPSHGCVLLRFLIALSLLCLLFSKPGVVRFASISRSFIQKLNEIGPSIELRGTTCYLSFSIIFHSRSWGEVCVCVLCVLLSLLNFILKHNLLSLLIQYFMNMKKEVFQKKMHSFINSIGN